MYTQLCHAPSGICLFNPHPNFQQLFDAISACLCKAEALAVTAATTDFENYDTEIINNYMWTLSDLIREAKWLHSKTTSCEK